jgi:hypothetical protein
LDKGKGGEGEEEGEIEVEEEDKRTKQSPQQMLGETVKEFVEERHIIVIN